MSEQPDTNEVTAPSPGKAVDSPLKITWQETVRLAVQELTDEKGEEYHSIVAIEQHIEDNWARLCGPKQKATTWRRIVGEQVGRHGTGKFKLKPDTKNYWALISTKDTTPSKKRSPVPDEDVKVENGDSLATSSTPPSSKRSRLSHPRKSSQGLRSAKAKADKTPAPSVTTDSTTADAVDAKEKSVKCIFSGEDAVTSEILLLPNESFDDLMQKVASLENAPSKDRLEIKYRDATNDLINIGPFLPWSIFFKTVASIEAVVTHEVTQEVTPEVTHEVTKEVTHEVTQEVTHEVTKDVTQEVTKEVRHEVTHEVAHEVTHEVAPAVTPVVTNE